MNLFNLYASIELDDSKYKSGLLSSEASMKSFASKSTSSIASMATSFNDFSVNVAKKMATAIGAVTTAIGGFAVAGVKYNAEIENYTTSFEVMLGSADKAREVIENLKAVGSATPFELSDLAKTTQTLINFGFTVEDAQESLLMLGDISQGNAEKMNSISTAFGKMSSSGKVALDQINVMIDAGFNPLQEISDTTGESMASLYDRISKGTLSVDEITASMQRSTAEGGKYYDSMNKMSQTFDGLKSTLVDGYNQLIGALSSKVFDNMTTNILPSLINLMGDLKESFEVGGFEGFADTLGGALSDGLTVGLNFIPKITGLATSIIQGFAESFLKDKSTVSNAFSTALEGIMEAIRTMIPLVSELTATIIPVLAQAFLSGYPLIWELGLSVITGIVTGINDNLGQILDAGLNSLMSFADSLIQQLPLLITAGVEIVTKLAEYIASNVEMIVGVTMLLISTIVKAVLDNLPVLIVAGVDIVIALVEGIAGNSDLILNTFIQIMGSMIVTIISFIPQLISSGFELLVAVNDGIKSFQTSLINAVFNIFKSVVSTILGFVGEMISSGKTLLLNVWNGITSYVGTLISNVKGAFNKVVSAITSIDFKKIGKDMISNIWDGISSMTSWLTSKVSGIFGSITSAFKGSSADLTVMADMGQAMATNTNNYSTVSNASTINFNQTINSPTATSAFQNAMYAKNALYTGGFA